MNAASALGAARLGSDVSRAGWMLPLLLAAVVAVAAGTALAATAPAATTPPSSPPKPAVSPRTASADDIPLGRSAQPSRPAGAQAGRGSSDTGLSAWRVMGALALVLCVIFVLRYAGRGLMGLPAAANAAGAIRVLGRTTISPRQQLMLVQVGRRVVLVANAGTQMNALCEINDADEIAALIGQLQEQRSQSAAGSFFSFFRRAGADYQPPASEAHPPDPTPAAAEENLDPTLATTRQELDGLLARVRTMSRNLRRN